MTRTLGRIAGGLIWLAIIVAIALGAAGIVTGMDHAPGTPARPDVTAGRRRRSHADARRRAGRPLGTGRPGRGPRQPGARRARRPQQPRLRRQRCRHRRRRPSGRGRDRPDRRSAPRPGVRALCRHADRRPDRLRRGRRPARRARGGARRDGWPGRRLGTADDRLRRRVPDERGRWPSTIGSWWRPPRTAVSPSTPAR